MKTNNNYTIEDLKENLKGLWSDEEIELYYNNVYWGVFDKVNNPISYEWLANNKEHAFYEFANIEL